jgi:hypothetical protein
MGRGFLPAIIQDGETYGSSGGKEQFLERGFFWISLSSRFSHVYG